MARRTAIQSAETLAALRAMVANESDLAVRCDDPLAKLFLGLKYRMVTGIRPQPLLKRIVHVAAPGSYCFTIVRTRHFDEILLSEIRAGIEQVVLLGAGYDSRAFRYQEELGDIGIFEIDHPGTQARKKRILEKVSRASPAKTRLRRQRSVSQTVQIRRADSLWKLLQKQPFHSSSSRPA